MAVVVMTGGTSGFGAIAARRLTERGHRVILGARDPGAVDPLLGQALPLDLGDLATVRSFAAALEMELAGEPIGVFAGNAGLSYTHVDARTADGWEATFGVNHLGHYLLMRLLEPGLPAGARVVLTTSGVHDPRERAPIPSPRHADAALLARPSDDPGLDRPPGRAGGHAYSASKLCNLLTVRELRRTRPDLVVLAFDPGPTPGTRLSRSFRLPLRLAWALLGTRLGTIVPGLSRPAEVGAALADLLSTAESSDHRYYVRFRGGRPVWTEPSELARDDAVAAALWRDSAELVALATDSS